VELAGKVALVTGAAGGTGTAVCRRLAAEGMIVALNGRRAEPLEALATELRAAGGEALVVPGDCTQETAAAMVVAAAAARGPVALLVHALNHPEFPHWPLEAITPERWDRALTTKLRSAYLLSRALVPLMLARGEGTLVFIASGGAVNPAPEFTAFIAGEFALRGFALSLALEVEPRGLHVALLLPVGTIDLPRTRQRAAASGSQARPETWLAPEDLADAVVFLARQGPRARTVELAVRPPAPVYG
jgi:NAD(P)-dependent dehydrogenase (short-subunit alcohol dehydrogenase family)